MTWILIIFMTGPGGDFISKQELVMPTEVACKRAAVDLKGAKDIMGLRYEGKCVKRDRKGLNVGNEALD